VVEKVRDAGGHVDQRRGAEAAEWGWSTSGDVVVHIMQPAARDYYALEEIWGAASRCAEARPAGARPSRPPERGDRD